MSGDRLESRCSRTTSPATRGIDDATGIDRIPVNDGGHDQVERRCPDRQVFLATISKAAEAMKVDGAHEISSRGFSELLVVDLVEGEAGSLDSAYLPQRLGETALPWSPIIAST